MNFTIGQKLYFNPKDRIFKIRKQTYPQYSPAVIFSADSVISIYKRIIVRFELDDYLFDVNEQDLLWWFDVKLPINYNQYWAKLNE